VAKLLKETTMTEMSAEQLYAERRQQALDALAEIHRLICENMDAAANRTPSHYTHAGSMGYIVVQLNDIAKFASR